MNLPNGPLPAEAKAFFCDTSFFYAVLDGREKNHSKAVDYALFIEKGKVPLFTTWEIVLETVTLLRYHYSHKGAVTFIKTVLPHLNVVHLGSEERAKALRLFVKLSKDKSISLCDAISFLVVSEKLDHVPCLAFDDDFRRMGLRVCD